MPTVEFCLVTDRGGHLHNAMMMIEQMGTKPEAIITTNGPDIDELKKQVIPVYCLPYLFQWAGKTRFFNPLRLIIQLIASYRLAKELQPRFVVSTGASNVVLFCYWARFFGADIYHVECMNQVKSASVTGRLLYPICAILYVQWEELLQKYGSKAQYAGWVL